MVPVFAPFLFVRTSEPWPCSSLHISNKDLHGGYSTSTCLTSDRSYCTTHVENSSFNQDSVYNNYDSVHEFGLQLSGCSFNIKALNTKAKAASSVSINVPAVADSPRKPRVTRSCSMTLVAPTEIKAHQADAEASQTKEDSE